MTGSKNLLVRIVLTLAVVFSLLSLPGTVSKSLNLPEVYSAWALPAPCPTKGITGVCSEYWLPAGAALDHLTDIIMGDCEFQDILTGSCNGGPPGILSPDLTDIPVPSSLIGTFNASSIHYLTAPVSGGAQFVYLSNWQDVSNSPSSGIPTFFTWLNAYSPNPAVAGTVRQGFAQSTRTVNPYAASTVWDFYLVGNIYDSLESLNPLNSAELLDWTTVSSSQTPLLNSQLTYVPPPGTVGTYRFTLRGDLFFQDGRKATAFDVAFSYLSLKANGAFQASGASGMTGITVLGPTQFDIGVNSTTLFTKPNLTSLSILPGAYWSSAGFSTWNSAVSACTRTNAACYPAQYTLGPTPPSGPAQAQCSMICTFAAVNMNADPSKTSVTFDPIVNHSLVGSGPWSCGLVTSSGSGSCSSSGSMNPPLGGSYFLTRFGSGLAIGSSVSGDYFRSNANLALWIWSQQNGDPTHDFLNFAGVALCFGKPIQPAPDPCAHFQQGIGTGGTAMVVGLSQVAVVARFHGVNWVSPFNWITNPPTGIHPLPGLILHSGSVTLSPASVVGCPTGYDC